jgi:hypothetical protein
MSRARRNRTASTHPCASQTYRTVGDIKRNGFWDTVRDTGQDMLIAFKVFLL